LASPAGNLAESLQTADAPLPAPDNEAESLHE